MMTQREKNKERLMDEIEKYRHQPITESIAERLSVYRGALNALCMDDEDAEPKTEPEPKERTTHTADRYEPTLALDGDTEFERAVMAVPTDWEHMEKLIHVFTIHMENLAFANNRAYNKIIDQIKQIARS